MSRFEFNTVLVSIVLAFAISEILTAWGRLIRDRSRISRPGLFVLASSWVLAAIVVHWFGLWAYSEAPFDRILDTLLILMPALVIALVCFVWVPDLSAGEPFDVEAHYFDASGWAFPLVALFIVLGGVADHMVPRVSFGPPLWSLLPAAALLVGLAFARRRSVHVAVLSLLWVVYLAMIVGLRR